MVKFIAAVACSCLVRLHHRRRHAAKCLGASGRIGEIASDVHVHLRFSLPAWACSAEDVRAGSKQLQLLSLTSTSTLSTTTPLLPPAATLHCFSAACIACDSFLHTLLYLHRGHHGGARRGRRRPLRRSVSTTTRSTARDIASKYRITDDSIQLRWRRRRHHRGPRQD